MSLIKRIIFFTSILILWQGCANPISPTGGPKDTTPPRLDTNLSTANMQTFFTEREIIMHFDEWIQLDNIFGQLVVSPPLEYRPEIKARGKELLFRFDEREVLRDSMTYTINFGNAVKDQTEGNKAGDLRFVFSTGPIIDSLFFKGKVTNAFSGEPETEVSVLLYRAGEDSVVAKEKPLYFSAADKNGDFSLENLREGSYILLALKDLNANLQYDLAGEAVAFSREPVQITDSTFNTPQLRLSTANAPVPVTGIRSSDAFSFSIGFADPPVLDVLLVNLKDSSVFVFQENDSLRVWFKNAEVLPDTLIIQQGESHKDSLPIPSLSTRLKALRFSSPSARLPMGPQRRILTEWDQPVLIKDTALVQLIDTSGMLIPLSLTQDTNDLRNITISAKLREAQNYRLEFLPGSMAQWNDSLLQDTLKTEIRVGKRSDFGRLILNVQELETNVDHILEVLYKETQPVHRVSVKGNGSGNTIDLDGYLPGNYSLRVIRDENGNGRWDPADYWEKKQPEAIFTIPLGELRANWELKLDVPIPADK